MSEPAAIDLSWLAGHPLPAPGAETDKDARGRVVVIGGSRRVPGAPLLTAEAALRAGAGKVQVAGIAEAAIGIGLAMPEAATIGLPETAGGEIGCDAVEPLTEAIARTDAVVFGPGMGDGDSAAALARAVLAPADGMSVVLDAAAVASARAIEAIVRAHDGRVVMTPHLGEMARLCDCPVETIAADRVKHAQETAERFGAVVVLKGGSTLVAAPGEPLLRYGGGGAGLATGGSGDVLAGIIGGLLARGAPPRVASAWGVWVHGEAGRQAAATIGPIGFLGRELLPLLPRVMASVPGEP